MSYDKSLEDTHDKLARLEEEVRELRAAHVQSPGAFGFKAQVVGSELRYLYVPTGAVGPAIGTQ